jgi:hypothetical protein
VQALLVDDLLDEMDDGYNEEMIFDMEVFLLRVLGFRLGLPSPRDFLWAFVHKIYLAGILRDAYEFGIAAVMADTQAGLVM